MTVTEEKFSLFGFIDLRKADDEWMTRQLPEPVWLTKMDFSEYL